MDPAFQIGGFLNGVFRFFMFNPVLDGASCLGEVCDEVACVQIISPEFHGCGVFGHGVAFRDVDVFGIEAACIGC